MPLNAVQIRIFVVLWCFEVFRPYFYYTVRISFKLDCHVHKYLYLLGSENEVHISNGS